MTTNWTEIAERFAATQGPAQLLPPPLPEPSEAEIELSTVFKALSMPIRHDIVRRLATESTQFDHPCGWFGFDKPKSSLTSHFRALREAGLIRQRQYGMERRSRIRYEDLEARFPGLLEIIING